MKLQCDVYRSHGMRCQGTAVAKVPMWGWDGPYLVCSECVKGWKEWQPENVKKIDDDTPWTNPRTGKQRDSKIRN